MKTDRSSIGVELEYCEMIMERLKLNSPSLFSSLSKIQEGWKVRYTFNLTPGWSRPGR